VGSKSRKVEGEKRAVVKEESSSAASSSREGESGSESGSDEDAMPITRKREATPVVERDVSARLGGEVECLSGEKLVLGNRGMYRDCEYCL
jgi:hypothetical protein